MTTAEKVKLIHQLFNSGRLCACLDSGNEHKKNCGGKKLGRALFNYSFLLEKFLEKNSPTETN
jgi:hypothetical protein